MIWEKADSPNSSARHFSVDQDVILVYAVNKEIWRPNKMPRNAAIDAKYKNRDDDPRGRWFGDNLSASKPYSRGVYAIKTPSGRVIPGPPRGAFWRISEERLWELNAANGIWWGAGGDGNPKFKRYLSEVGELVPRTLWTKAEIGSNRTAKSELKALFPDEDPFSTPKPERLLQRIIHLATKPGDIVLDFFAGSGTTASVAQKMGRRWVTCELNADSVDKYVKPRITKVVRGADGGGITITEARDVADEVELPEDVLPDEAQRFVSLLSKFEEHASPEVDVEAIVKSLARKSKTNPKPIDADVWPDTDSVQFLVGRAVEEYVDAIKAAAKTKIVRTTTWHGGGSFRHVVVGQSMFEQIDEYVVIADWAREGDLARAVAAQFEFRYNDSIYPFAGIKGRRRLAVIDGSVDAPLVEHIQSYLGEKESVAIYGTAIDPLARGALSRGSTLDAVPAAIWDNYRKTVRRSRPVDWATAVKEEA